MRRGVNTVDLAAGLALIGLALAALALAWPLRAGTAVQMGPGYVPQLLCWLQLALGALIVAQAFVSGARASEPWAVRPLVCILASIAFFALALEPLGLVVALMGLVGLSCLAHRGTRPVEAILLGAGLAVFAAAVFVLALRLPIPVWPRLGS